MAQTLTVYQKDQKSEKEHLQMEQYLISVAIPSSSLDEAVMSPSSIQLGVFKMFQELLHQMADTLEMPVEVVQGKSHKRLDLLRFSMPQMLPM